MTSNALSEEKKGKFIHIFQDIYFKMFISNALSEEKKSEYSYISRYILQDVDIRWLIGGEIG